MPSRDRVSGGPGSSYWPACLPPHARHPLKLAPLCCLNPSPSPLLPPPSSEDVQELELKVDVASLERLLDFLARPPPSSLLPLLSEDVQELELKVDVASLERLLDFLARSFMGGTDVDRPLGLALDRLKQQEWAQV